MENYWSVEELEGVLTEVQYQELLAALEATDVELGGRILVRDCERTGCTCKEYKVAGSPVPWKCFGGGLCPNTNPNCAGLTWSLPELPE